MKAVFFFEDITANISSGNIDSTIQRMSDSLKALGATHVLMVDLTTYQIGQYYTHGDSEITFERYTSLEDLETAHSMCNFVYVEDPDKLDAAGVSHTGLDSFTCPANPVFVVGPDTGVVNILTGREDKTFVSIDAGLLWAETALVITADKCRRG